MLDDKGVPVNYRFLEVNPAFEKMTGLKSREIIGKTVLETIPAINDGGFDWISIYGKVALTGEEKVFEQYSQPLQKWNQVHVYSHEKGFLLPYFRILPRIKCRPKNWKGFSL
jgi:PAS domain-containing protein